MKSRWEQWLSNDKLDRGIEHLKSVVPTATKSVEYLKLGDIIYKTKISGKIFNLPCEA